MNRRTFLFTAAAASAPSLLARKANLKVGVTDWNLKLTGNIEAVALARNLAFDGVQVSIGRKPVDGKLPLDDPAMQQQYLDASKAHRIPLDGTCLDILHVNYLKNDKLGEKWVSDGIRVTKALGAKVMLLPFFGRGALTTPAEMDFVGDVLKNLASEAEKAQVILGLENTISATDNLRILDRVKSKAVLIYYDIGNSANQGFDVIREIRQIGSKRICQFHFKDNPNYLGEGKIDLSGVLHSISEIEYQGFANLETECPSKSVEADMRRNLTFVRRVMAQNGM